MSRFYFSVIFPRSRDQTKQTLALTLLLQCSNGWQFGVTILFFYRILSRILSIGCWINTKVFIGFTIPSAFTQTFPRLSWTSKLLYVDKVWRRTINLFNIKRSSWIHIRKILSDTKLIMLERTMYLAIILLLVQYRFQNHWSDGKHNAKVRAVN